MDLADRRNAVRSQGGAAAVRDNVDELDLSLRSKDRERHFLFILEVCKRGLLYVLAVFGIIAVGCLSGLPSAVNCFALEDAYTMALYFSGGLTGLMTVIVYLGISTGEQLIKRGKMLSTLDTTFGFVSGVGIPLLLFLFAIFFLTDRGVQNVRMAIEHCRLVDEAAARKDKIPLYRTIFGEPR
jgi:hypothetical protein